MGISAKQAAEQVGMSKAGIIKAIRSGKLSATKGVNGEWEIEPVELFRVYKPASTQRATVDTNSTPDQTISMQEKIALLEQIIADQKETISKLFDRIPEPKKDTLAIEDKQRPKAWWLRWLGQDI
jgi:hypothetical protein